MSTHLLAAHGLSIKEIDRDKTRNNLAIVDQHMPIKRLLVIYCPIVILPWNINYVWKLLQTFWLNQDNQSSVDDKAFVNLSSLLDNRFVLPTRQKLTKDKFYLRNSPSLKRQYRPSLIEFNILILPRTHGYPWHLNLILELQLILSTMIYSLSKFRFHYFIFLSQIPVNS